GAPDYAVDRGPPCSVRPPRDAAPRRESALGAMAAMAPARVAAAPPAATPTVLADAPPQRQSAAAATARAVGPGRRRSRRPHSRGACGPCVHPQTSMDRHRPAYV